MSSDLAVLSPLEPASAVRRLETVRARDIAWTYARAFGVDVSRELGSTDSLGLYECEQSGLRFFHPAPTGSEGFYQSLQKLSWYYQQRKPEYDFAKQYFEPGVSVLEVGCGEGHFCEVLREHLSNQASAVEADPLMRYLGLEFNDIARIVASNNGIEVLGETILRHSQHKAASYDVVCAFQVLEHVADPASFLDACVRCVKEGGLLIIAVPNADSFVGRTMNAVLNMPPHHVSWWSEKSLRFVAKKLGLQVVAVECEKLNDVHLGAYCATVIRQAVWGSLGIKPKALDVSLPARVAAKLFALAGQFLSRGMYPTGLRPSGHTITVVLRKPKVLVGNL